VVSPPRERPSPSRPAPARRLLSFGPAPCGQVRGAGPARPGRVLVGPYHRRIRADRPVAALGLITPSPQLVQDSRPGPIAGPAPVPLIHRQPVPVLAGQVPPWAARPGTEQDPVDGAPVISPPAPAARVTRQHLLQPRPLLILKIMTGNHSKVIYTPPSSRSRKHALAPRARPATPRRCARPPPPRIRWSIADPPLTCSSTRGGGGRLPVIPIGVVPAAARAGRVIHGSLRPSSMGLAAFVVDALPATGGSPG
jgi:hypothetical protein